MVQHRKTSRRAGAPTAYYVFNVEQDKGFVVVSGDDRTVPVLGYGETGAFDVDNMPENMKAWLQGYVDQIEWLNAHPETPVATKATRRSSSAVRVRTERTIYRQRAISDKIKKRTVWRDPHRFFFIIVFCLYSLRQLQPLDVAEVLTVRQVGVLRIHADG